MEQILKQIFDGLLIFGFCYAVGVIFLPLLVLDVLEGFLSEKTTTLIHRAQFWPVINFLLFTSLFITMLLYIIWLGIEWLVWDILWNDKTSKMYPKIKVPPKYQLENLKNKRKKNVKQ